ncbi:hypothetical protein INT45_011749 [Circinella minor]|uniref:Uncharacterized protein n=1 Tax=Circinella minor TaxID=1195481 RepID=A0A8H7VP48_9FUNG|nr:hypothetical protein INT45_011749 [Circinella minor]
MGFDRHLSNLCLLLKKAVKENSLIKSAGEMTNILEENQEKEKSAVRAMVWPSGKETDNDEVCEDGEYLDYYSLSDRTGVLIVSLFIRKEDKDGKEDEHDQKEEEGVEEDTGEREEGRSSSC